MDIKRNLLAPVRYGWQTANFLGSAALHAADGVMTNLSGWKYGEKLAQEHVPNLTHDITKEMAERSDDTDLLVLNAARLCRVAMHAQQSAESDEPLSEDYRAIVELAFQDNGFSEAETQDTLQNVSFGSDQLTQLVESPYPDANTTRSASNLQPDTV